MYSPTATPWLALVTEPSAGGKRDLDPYLESLQTGAGDGEGPSRESWLRLVACDREVLPSLCRRAAQLRDEGKGRTVTFSPKVFVPLTRLCRDFCGYCTFRQDPSEADTLYLSPQQALAVAGAGREAGCTEALFTLGERPEQRYPEAKDWLRAHGYATTLEYLEDVCELIVRETGLLPHLNAGTMSRREIASLRPVSASMGIMLENVSPRLAESGGPHERAPSKWPSARLKTHEWMGRLDVAFTSGLLIGIGESRAERIDSLLAIRALHRRHGHIQEVIIQNFRAKPDTPMRNCSDADMEEMLWTVAVARLILGPSANVQVPPNLNQEDYPVYLAAGVNDWGGVSPVTIDYVNPEAPWPQLETLRHRTEALGFDLRPRLPLYPEIVKDEAQARRFAPESLVDSIRALADGEGYVRGGMARYVA